MSTKVTSNHWKPSHMAHPRKDQLIAVASDLFNRYGYHQAGVDMIMRQSGVSKTTLYKYFPTKEDLILDILKRRSDDFMERVHRRLETTHATSSVPKSHAAITVILDVFEEWIRGSAFFGCNFARASAEYGDPEHAIYIHACAHKDRVETLLASVLTELAPEDAKRAARQIMLVIDGAITTAQVRGCREIMDEARQLVSMILVQFSPI
ncbi:TetR/AcrR family transcriptional regulator [Asticcacaulis sp. DXS10W]|uniref:TetR/AcrR family transcriptional regulator n=1 Tax=Asticcacaulis currens TaxID=2984210 RepID=A0ABT5IEJ2_9CAUL|nr:TetR/AcrR family transcriptional regulator [Asticcacaulis currens]MDC7694270.1 TetR/AcrR family transcriptional regulator [Asticcacaulis currens]